MARRKSVITGLGAFVFALITFMLEQLDIHVQIFAWFSYAVAFILSICAAWNTQYRVRAKFILIGCIVVGFVLFGIWVVHHKNRQIPTTTTLQTTTNVKLTQHSQGANSPNIAGNGNTVTYNQSGVAEPVFLPESVFLFERYTGAWGHADLKQLLLTNGYILKYSFIKEHIYEFTPCVGQTGDQITLEGLDLYMSIPSEIAVRKTTKWTFVEDIGGYKQYSIPIDTLNSGFGKGANELFYLQFPTAKRYIFKWSLGGSIKGGRGFNRIDRSFTIDLE